ncbi:aminopeptidase P N-terminal domain-containing protein [bacterium]|nr:aminopeptidase P N-terminal domain-containing protein [candidate division CSSED10-310 bacterium]
MNQMMIQAFADNRKRVFEQMPNNSAVLLTSAPPKIRSGDTPYPYCQDKNFYYLTGHNQRHAALLLIKKGTTTTTQMFVVRLTPLQIHWMGPIPGPEEVSKLTGISSVKSIDSLPDTLHRILQNLEILYVDFSPVSTTEPLTESLQLTESLRIRNPHLTIKNAASILTPLRTIKADWEVQRVKNAIRLTFTGLSRMLQEMAPGKTEYTLDAWFTLALQLERSVPAFPTIAATGKNATILHYTQLNDTLQDGDLLLLDLGAEYMHYSADISRTFPVNGTFTAQQRDLYTLVLEANVETIKAVKPGMSLMELNDITRNVLAAGMQRLGYITQGAEIANYYTHGVSHMLGLDTHDVHPDDNRLVPGMVITVEPGLYLENEGIGIRIEDDVLVTDSGSENLSADIPKTAKDVENWIRNVQSQSGR